MTVREVGIEEGIRLRADGAVVVDVREPFEWQAGHIPDALHIPLGELPSRLGAEAYKAYGREVNELVGRINGAYAWRQLRHAFVLRPAAEIAPDWVHPVERVTLADLWAAHADRHVAFERVALTP